jgi:metal-dependent HD superfamily phosphatase/phosphodiesterase
MLPKPIRTAVNRFAHAQGTKHAEITRNRVIAALEALRANGMTQDELLQHVEGIATETQKEPK